MKKLFLLIASCLLFSSLAFAGSAVNVGTSIGANDNNFTASQTMNGISNNGTTVLKSSVTVYGSINTGGKHWEMIWSTTTVATQTSIPTGNILNGNVDVKYWIMADFIGASAADNGMQINADTGANYGRVYNQGTGTTNSVATNSGTTQVFIGYIPNAGYFTHTDLFLYALVGYNRPRLYSGTNVMNMPANADATGSFVINYGGIWNNTADNIISMTFVGQFAAGSHFEIWALR